MRWFPALLLALVSASTDAAEDKLRLVRETEALTPTQEQTKLHAPAGFTVQLFASEPMINKPINMAFDARGRLWVSSTVEYPYAAAKDRWADAQGSRVKDSRDAIKILEDTDSDGKADKVTDFADGLNIPTGVLPWHKPEHKDGCIAWSIPNIWYFADTDGDGRADLREVLFGPLGYEKDTHGMCSSFRLGLDGWVYATHGFNNTSHFKVLPQHNKPGTGNPEPGTLDLHSGNVFRFRPDGSRVELWSAGQVNPFGLCWDRYNHLYSADCHSNPVTQLLRGAHYPSFGKPHDGLGFAPVMCEHSHGSTGLCGIIYIDGGIWGPEWDDHMFLGNCVTSKVNHDKVTFTGSTPKANEAPDFINSDDPWFRPVDLQLGPDNALYIADFYNKIIGHYEVPLDHPGRDKERGRIWCVVREDHKSTAPSDFTAMSSAQIAGELGSPNLTRRHFALHEVKRRGTKEWLPDLFTIFEQPKSGAALQPVGDKTPVSVRPWDTSPSDFDNNGFDFKTADTRTAFSLWALSYLGERFAISAVMRDLHTGGWWVEDARDENNLVVPDRQMGLVMSHAAQILGSYEHLHPWEKWNLGIVFDCRGSAAGTAVCQVLLNRPDVIDDDPSWQMFTTEDLIEVLRRLLAPKPDDDGLQARHKPDPQFAHAMKLLLRDWFSRPNVFTNVMSSERAMRLQKDSINAEWFKEVLYAVPSADVSRWLINSFIDDNSAALRQIATYGDVQTVRAMIPRAWGIAKVGGLAAMHEGFLQRGGALPPEFIQVCAEAAEWLLSDESRRNPQWELLPHPDFPKSESPWCMQERKCADGEMARVVSSLDHDRKSPEKLTGILRSKPFAAPEKLSFWICGHQGFPNAPANQKNFVRLVEDGKMLRQAFAPRNDVCQRVEWDLREIKGRRVQLEIVDGDDGTAFAWLGVTRIEPRVIRVDTFQSDNERQKQLRTIAGILRTNAPVSLRDKLKPWLPKPAKIEIPRPQPEVEALIATRRAAFAKAKPDVTKGELVFKANCAVCHTIKGVGGLIGPQLDGIGTRGADRLIEDVLDPNRNVDAHFHLHQLKLRDGSTATGFVRGEVGQVTILVDAANNEQRVAKGDIAEDIELPQSLMPLTFGQTIPADAFNDLIGWLLTR